MKHYGKKYRQTYPKEYRAWSHMKTRCSNPNYPMFHRYGGRGIRVCRSWADDFENFLRDMGKAPSPDHTLDRIDTDGHYEPSNCTWSNQLCQQNNRHDNRVICIDGVEKTAAEWAREHGIAYLTFMRRLYLGWSAKSALAHKPGSSLFRYHTPDGIFSSQKEVADFYGLNPSTVSNRFCSASFADWRKESIKDEVP